MTDYMTATQIAQLNKSDRAMQKASAGTRLSYLNKVSQTVVYTQFTDGGSTSGTFTLTDGTIPAGAVVLRSTVTAVTGFTGDTTATLIIGDGTDTDRYNTGTPSVFTTADAVDAGAVSGTAFHAAAKTPVLTVTS